MISMFQCRDPQQYEITKNCYEQMACQQLLWQHSLCFVVLCCTVLCCIVFLNCLVQLQHYCFSLYISTGNSLQQETLLVQTTQIHQHLCTRSGPPHCSAG